MTFEEAIRKAMKVYWENTDDFDGLQSNKSRKYNKKYFDSVETEMLGSKDGSKESKEYAKGKK